MGNLKATAFGMVLLEANGIFYTKGINVVVEGIEALTKDY